MSHSAASFVPPAAVAPHPESHSDSKPVENRVEVGPKQKKEEAGQARTDLGETIKAQVHKQEVDEDLEQQLAAALTQQRSQVTDTHPIADEFAESSIPSFPTASSSSKAPLGLLSRQPDWLAAPSLDSSSTHQLTSIQSNQSAVQPDAPARALAAPAKLPSLKGVPMTTLPVPRRISGPAPGGSVSILHSSGKDVTSAVGSGSFHRLSGHGQNLQQPEPLDSALNAVGEILGEDGAADAHPAASHAGTEQEAVSRTSDASSSHLMPPAAAALQVSAVHDPWSALASHYSAADLSSPDPTQYGAAPRGHARASREELVLVESDEDGACSSSSSSTCDSGTERGASGMVGVGGRGESGRSAGGQERYKHEDADMPRREGSGKSSAPKAGGWGKGQLATAGTLMLGSHGPGKDGVFDDDDEGSVPGALASKAMRHEGSGSSVGMSATSSQAELPRPGAALQGAAVAGAVHDELGFEDIDEDTMHFGSGAGTGGIADDLAAKLAQFEAMVDEDD